jgi:hypothetical protein
VPLDRGWMIGEWTRDDLRPDHVAPTLLDALALVA